MTDGKYKEELSYLLHSEARFRYMMLSRFQMDCNYFLGNGCRNEKHLWAGDVKQQISLMKELHNSFADDVKPEWLTYEQIEYFEKIMSDTFVIPCKVGEWCYVIPQKNNNLKGIAKMYCGDVSMSDSDKEVVMTLYPRNDYAADLPVAYETTAKHFGKSVFTSMEEAVAACKTLPDK